MAGVNQVGADVRGPLSGQDTWVLDHTGLTFATREVPGAGVAALRCLGAAMLSLARDDRDGRRAAAPCSSGWVQSPIGVGDAHFASYNESGLLRGARATAPAGGGSLTTAATSAERVLDDSPTLVIQPSSGWTNLGLRELWRYRELLFFLTWRDVLIRYKQAVLGVAWAVLNPVLTMVVFTVVFNRLLGVPSSSPDLPYEVFLYAGLLPWQLFAGALSRSGTSLVGNAALITKVYFPRLVIPTSGVLATLPDFLISCGVLTILMALYGVAPTWQIVFLPLFVLLALVTALGVSLWLSALNVLYRDVQYIIPFLVQLWMFLSPVFYPTTKIDTYPGWAQLIYNLNPMTVVIGGFRWALFGQQSPNQLLWVSALMVMVVFVGGLYYFRRMERVFADVV